LPRAPAATPVGGIGGIAGTGRDKGRVGAARSANAADVGLALRERMEAAIGAAAGVAGTPCAVGARRNAGDGECGQPGEPSRDDNQSPHENLLADETPTCRG